MSFFHHTCMRKTVPQEHSLFGKSVYVPAMTDGSVEALCSVLRWMGVDAQPTPTSDERTLQLGGKYTTGDECYPLKITIGDFVRVMEQPTFDSKRTIFLMASGGGPCRFGQYAVFFNRLLAEIGQHEVPVLSPTTEHGYSEIGDFGTAFVRGVWRALVAADLLRKKLLMTRPYEAVPGRADTTFAESISDLCNTIEESCSEYDCQLKELQASLQRARTESSISAPSPA